MIVYVESDFILKLALKQDDHRTAGRLLDFAGRREIELKLPVFCLSEPFATLRYRANARQRLADELLREARELGRTEPHEVLAEALRRQAVEMVGVFAAQSRALERVVLDLSQHCTLLPLDAATLERAVVYRDQHGLQAQDATVLASVVLDLEREPTDDAALFVSQNSKDYEQPSIADLLQRLSCKYLADFGNAVRYIERLSG